MATQRESLNVTEIARQVQEEIQPICLSYPLRELRDALVPTMCSNYFRGRSLDFDVPVFLNPILFAQGFGTGSSYVGEAYVIGGVAGVIIISLLIGFALRLAHYFSRNAVSLFVVALVLPKNLDHAEERLARLGVRAREKCNLDRGAGAGWQLYSFLASIRQSPRRRTGCGRGSREMTSDVARRCHR